MRLIRFLSPFILGFVSLYVVMFELRRFMAARGVPVDYFRLFGKEHQELALFTTNVAFHLIPEALVLIGGVVLSALLFNGRRRNNAALFTIGAFTSYVFWFLYYQVLLPAPVDGALNPNWRALLAQFTGPWWAAPSLLSPVIGVALGVWLTTRGTHAAARAEA